MAATNPFGGNHLAVHRILVIFVLMPIPTKFECRATELAKNASVVADLLKAVANQSRLLVLCYLATEGELSVTALVDRIELSQSALSQHLAKLREERLVATRREAQTIYYRIADPRVAALMTTLHDLYCVPESQRAA